MTTNQVIYLLNELGYAEDEWIDASAISIIGMKQDTNFYTNPNTIRLKFNTAIGIIEISYGTIINEVFVSHFEEESDYTADSFISFSNINCFITSTYPLSFGTYYQKPFWTKLPTS